jgi:hypothetical protein
MKRVNDAALFDRMIQRVRSNADYLGWIFGRYAQIETKDEAEIAELLGVPIEALHRLYLCLRPRQTSFIRDVRHIAENFDIESAVLSKVIRHVESMEEMKEEAGSDIANQAGLMVAARARKPKAKQTGKRKK